MSINVIVCFLTSSDGCFSILNIYFTGRRRKTKAATRDAWRFPRGLSWWFPRRCGRIPWGLPWWCRRIPRGRWGIHWYWRSRRYLKTAVSQPLHVSKLYRRHKRSYTSTTGGKKWRTPMTKPYFLTFFLQGWYYCVTPGNSNLLKKVSSGYSLTSEMESYISSAAVGITVSFTCSSQKAQLGQEGTCGL